MSDQKRADDDIFDESDPYSLMNDDVALSDCMLYALSRLCNLYTETHKMSHYYSSVFKRTLFGPYKCEFTVNLHFNP